MSESIMSAGSTLCGDCCMLGTYLIFENSCMQFDYVWFVSCLGLS